MAAEEIHDGALLDAPVLFPEHVVFRSFAHETVALNLRTGRFHGLNDTAGRMLQLVQRCALPRDAVAPLASEYGVSCEEVARDLERLLELLLERELIGVRR
jgi:hypothetical protein